MKNIITYLILILLSGNSYSLDLKVIENSERFKERTDTSEWFGWVEASRAYEGNHKETVLEFYCHKLEPVDLKKLRDYENVVYVDPEKENEAHFVATLRTPEMKLEKAQELLKSMLSSTHFCHYPRAIVTREDYFTNKKASFLAGDLIISNKYKVKDKE